jgi:hypothetical protein
MRSILMVLIAAVLLASCGGEKVEGAAQTAAPPEPLAAQAASGTPGGVPTLRPGLWRTVIARSGDEPKTEEKCLTAEESQRMAQSPFAGMEGTEGCRDVAVRREGGAIVTRASCSAGGTSSALETRTTGDFQNRYDVAVTMRINGPEPQEMRFTLKSVRLGDC